MTGWILDYDGAALTLRVPEGEAEALNYRHLHVPGVLQNVEAALGHATRTLPMD